MMSEWYAVAEIHYSADPEAHWRWSQTPDLKYVVPSPHDIDLRQSGSRMGSHSREPLGQEYQLRIRCPQGYLDVDSDRQALYFRMGGASESSVFDWTIREVVGYGRLYQPAHRFEPVSQDWDFADRVAPEEFPLGPIRWEVGLRKAGGYKNNRIVEDLNEVTGYKEICDDVVE